MLAIAYIVAMLALGDRLARRFFPSESLTHRASAAVLVGLLAATWVTYLASAVFAGLERPLLVGNAIFLGLVAVALRDVPGRLASGIRAGGPERLRRAVVREWPELAVLGVLMLLAAALSATTFAVRGSEMLIGNIVYSDFGSTTAISQSFAVGNNFPTVYPHFAGEPIRYHFLFYFQAGNLSFLGLDPALGLNLLSVLTLGAMLGMVMTLGRLLFRSAAVGWLGAALFFFHGSLAWVPYLTSQPLAAALESIPNRRDFLLSGFPYRGEEWGVWSMAIFANQRHFASGIGILLMVLIFLIGRRRRQREGSTGWLDGLRRWRLEDPRRYRWRTSDIGSYAFAGLLLGALPMWNGAVFVAAFVVLAALFVLLPERRYMLVMAVTAAVVALPQLEFLRPSAGVNAGYPAFHWGYVIDDPTPLNVVGYLAFTFGPKLLLAGLALFLARGLPLRLFIAVTALVVLAFTVQFSAEVLVNHKFLNIWLVVLNLFAAYALWRLWRARPVGNLMVGRLAAAVLVVVVTLGGVIDLMPFKNNNWLGVAYRDDPLADWVATRTESDAIFLSDIMVTHPILVRGRSLFLGWPYYAWSAGYEMGPREEAYRRLYTEADPVALTQMLRSHDISYVVFDDNLLARGFVQDPNEQVYRDNFAVAFEDPGYANIRIYAVP